MSVSGSVSGSNSVVDFSALQAEGLSDAYVSSLIDVVKSGGFMEAAEEEREKLNRSLES